MSARCMSLQCDTCAILILAPVCVVSQSAESNGWMTGAQCQAHKSVNAAKWHPAFGNDCHGCKWRCSPPSYNKRCLIYRGVLTWVGMQGGSCTVSVKHWLVATSDILDIYHCYQMESFPKFIPKEKVTLLNHLCSMLDSLTNNNKNNLYNVLIGHCQKNELF